MCIYRSNPYYYIFRLLFVEHARALSARNGEILLTHHDTNPNVNNSLSAPDSEKLGNYVCPSFRLPF